MKAVILIGSPRKDGNTDRLAEAFLAGLADAGGEGEKIYLDDLNIRPIGPVGDVFAERVDLRADDDYLTTLQRTLAADILVFASPVYWQGVSAQMKAFVDRWSAYYMTPMLRDGMRGKIIAALVPHGAPDPGEADWVTQPIQVWARAFAATYAGHVTVAAGKQGCVAEMPNVLAAARALGRECAALATK
jgi:multimeric flavodoxin WrbA